MARSETKPVPQLAEPHDAYSPSKLGTMICTRCPGRARMEHGVPEVDLGTGDFGTRAHAELKTIFDSQSSSTEHIDDEELRFLLGRCVAFAREHGFLEGRPRAEHPVTIRGWTDDVGTEGTVDLCRLNQDTAEAIDWKFTHTEVDEIDARMQVTAYLLGLMDEWRVHRGRAWVYMPYLDLAYAYEVDYDEALFEVSMTIAGAKEPEAPLRAGKWCRYCRAVISCPKVREDGARFLRELGWPGEYPAGTKTKLREHFEGEVAEWVRQGNLELLAEFSERFEALDAAVKVGRAMIKALLEREEAGPLGESWQLKQKRGSRQGKPGDIWPAVRDALGSAEFFEACDVKWTRLESLYTASLQSEAELRGATITKKKAREILERKLDQVTRRPVYRELRRR